MVIITLSILLNSEFMGIEPMINIRGPYLSKNINFFMFYGKIPGRNEKWTLSIEKVVSW